MDERAALALLAESVPTAGDDAAVVDDLVLTTDMLHERTDFPAGTSRYTAGWRSVAASLSDVAAMGATPIAAVAAYAAPTFEQSELSAFVRGARDVCDRVGADYVGGDLDGHQEFTVTTTAVGRTADPIGRDGARAGDVVCVTGTLGRSAAALALFDRGDADGRERANELFRFEPRIATGSGMASHATAMMDSSDGLARSLHQLGEASGCGFAIDGDRLPIDDALTDLIANADAVRERATTFGEDFELVATLPDSALPAVRTASDVPVTVVGEVVDAEAGITLDGEPLPDRGFTHG